MGEKEKYGCDSFKEPNQSVRSPQSGCIYRKENKENTDAKEQKKSLHTYRRPERVALRQKGVKDYGRIRLIKQHASV